MTHTKRWQVLNSSTRTLVVGMMQTPPYTHMFESARRVYSAKGLSPACLTHGGGNQEIKMLVEL
jgi:hypothetical protein